MNTEEALFAAVSKALMDYLDHCIGDITWVENAYEQIIDLVIELTEEEGE